MGLEVIVTAPIGRNELTSGASATSWRQGPPRTDGPSRDFADVALYDNDRQIHEVHYRWQRGTDARYRIRIWGL